MPPHVINERYGCGVTAPVVEILLAHGADGHAKDQDQEKPLHSLVGSESIEAVKVVLDHPRSSSRSTSGTMEHALLCAGKFKYLSSFTETVARIPTCGVKRQRDEAAVKLNTTLNDFQRNMAEAFVVNK